MAQSTLITIAIFLFVIVRFLIRELRERHLSQAQLFVLPIVIWAIALAFVAGAVTASPGRVPELVLESAIAAVFGAIIGFAVAHFTTVRTDPDGRIFFLGSYVTVAIWVAALLLRFGARALIQHSGSKDESTVANAALFVLIASGLTVVRVLVRRKAISERARGSDLAESAL